MFCDRSSQSALRLSCRCYFSPAAWRLKCFSKCRAPVWHQRCSVIAHAEKNIMSSNFQLPSVFFLQCLAFVENSDALCSHGGVMRMPVKQSKTSSLQVLFLLLSYLTRDFFFLFRIYTAANTFHTHYYEPVWLVCRPKCQAVCCTYNAMHNYSPPLKRLHIL